LLNCGDKEGIYTIELDKKLVTDTRSQFKVLQDRRDTDFGWITDKLQKK